MKETGPCDDFTGMQCVLPRAVSSAALLAIPVPDLDKIPDKSDDVGSILASNENTYSFSVKVAGSVPMITDDVLAGMLRSEYNDFDRVIVLDCRFHYEFKAGHILGATNLLTRAQMIQIYNDNIGKNVAIVFHCEFSTSRGPTWASLFRKYDREQNLRKYPDLDYPHCFILTGGYANFYTNYSDLCMGGYRHMYDVRDEGPHELRRCQRQYESETSIRRGARTPELHKQREPLDGSSVTAISFFAESQPVGRL